MPLDASTLLSAMLVWGLRRQPPLTHLRLLFGEEVVEQAVVEIEQIQGGTV